MVACEQAVWKTARVEASRERCERYNVGARGRTEHLIEVVVGERERIHRARSGSIRLTVNTAIAALCERGERGLAMKRVWTLELVRCARHVRRVVVAVTRPVVAVGENGQGVLRMGRRDPGAASHVVKRLLARVESQVDGLLLDAAYALRTGMAAATGGGGSLHLVFRLILVFLIATITLGVVGLGFARTATVLALLDGTALGVDVVQFAVCRFSISCCFVSGTTLSLPRQRTVVIATAHAVALDAGLARELFAIDHRHALRGTAECGRRTWLLCDRAVR